MSFRRARNGKGVVVRKDELAKDISCLRGQTQRITPVGGSMLSDGGWDRLEDVAGRDITMESNVREN